MNYKLPILVVALSTASVGDLSPAGIAGSNPTGGMDVSSLVSAVCCQVEVSAMGRFLVQEEFYRLWCF